jgi:UDP-N-acetylglucosamine diphosphorylase/glucosamine-1-phosphate N-acetyltransferase
MNIILSDNGNHQKFCPLTLTKPIGELRVGILKISDKYRKRFSKEGIEANICFETEAYLEGKYSKCSDGSFIWVNAQVLPDSIIIKEILELIEGEQLSKGDTLIAYHTNKSKVNRESRSNPIILNERWEMYQKNDRAINEDFEFLTKDRISQKIPISNQVLGDQVFLEVGAKVECSILNSLSGPIYLDEDSEIMEGSIVRGGLALGKHAVLKLGTKIYGPTTIGDHSKVGGEVNNSVFQSYSNKGHDGFIGNSLIGEWCNLGADTNTSNLKNNYGEVKTYSYETKKIEQTEVTFMGLAIGDHSKCGINTMFNTATTVGVNANIFGAGFPKKYIESYSWGGDAVYDFDKAIEVAKMVYSRRNKELAQTDIDILRHLYDSRTK